MRKREIRKSCFYSKVWPNLEAEPPSERHAPSEHCRGLFFRVLIFTSMHLFACSVWYNIIQWLNPLTFFRLFVLMPPWVRLLFLVAVNLAATEAPVATWNHEGPCRLACLFADRWSDQHIAGPKWGRRRKRACSSSSRWLLLPIFSR